MKLSGMTFFQTASQRMSWLGARQSVISENIANANTPAYKTKEVSSFNAMLRGAHATGQGVTVTDPRHISSTATTPSGVRVTRDETAGEASLDGNNVALEQETIKAADVAGSYRLAADLYRKGNGLLTLAVTGVR